MSCTQHSTSHEVDRLVLMRSTGTPAPNRVVVEEAAHLKVIGGNKLSTLGSIGADSLPANLAQYKFTRLLSDTCPRNELRRSAARAIDAKAKDGTAVCLLSIASDDQGVAASSDPKAALERFVAIH